LFFFKGFLIGFSIASPVGTIGILCIRRTLTDGRLCGLVSGLGAATADAIYGSIAGFGLTFLSSFLLHQQNWIRLVGGAFLCYLGIKIFLSKPVEAGSVSGGTGLLGAYLSTFFLTLTNPLTILSYAAVFAGLGLGSASSDYLASALLVFGVFCGSAFWWLILTGFLSLFRKHLSSGGFVWINRISGVMITGFGIAAVVSLSGSQIF
jgi:threonine/homoserine/homoserine lactone efflux protein